LCRASENRLLPAFTENILDENWIVEGRKADLCDQLGLLSQTDLALVLGITPETLVEWRRLKRGPDFVRAGKSVMYRRADVLDWIERSVVPIAP
jgi:hypothetical protein